MRKAGRIKDDPDQKEGLLARPISKSPSFFDLERPEQLVGTEAKVHGHDQAFLTVRQPVYMCYCVPWGYGEDYILLRDDTIVRVLNQASEPDEYRVRVLRSQTRVDEGLEGIIRGCWLMPRGARTPRHGRSSMGSISEMPAEAESFPAADSPVSAASEQSIAAASDRISMILSDQEPVAESTVELAPIATPSKPDVVVEVPTVLPGPDLLPSISDLLDEEFGKIKDRLQSPAQPLEAPFSSVVYDDLESQSGSQSPAPRSPLTAPIVDVPAAFTDLDGLHTAASVDFGLAAAAASASAPKRVEPHSAEFSVSVAAADTVVFIEEPESKAAGAEAVLVRHPEPKLAAAQAVSEHQGVSPSFDFPAVEQHALPAKAGEMPSFLDSNIELKTPAKVQEGHTLPADAPLSAAGAHQVARAVYTSTTLTTSTFELISSPAPGPGGAAAVSAVAAAAAAVLAPAAAAAPVAQVATPQRAAAAAPASHAVHHSAHHAKPAAHSHGHATPSAGGSGAGTGAAAVESKTPARAGAGAGAAVAAAAGATSAAAVESKTPAAPPSLRAYELPRGRITAEHINAIAALVAAGARDVTYPLIFAKLTGHKRVLEGDVLRPFVRLLLNKATVEAPDVPRDLLDVLSKLCAQIIDIRSGADFLEINFNFGPGVSSQSFTVPGLTNLVVDSKHKDPFLVHKLNTIKLVSADPRTFIIRNQVRLRMNQHGIEGLREGDIQLKLLVKFNCNVRTERKADSMEFDSSNRPFLETLPDSNKPLIRDGRYVPKKFNDWLVFTIPVARKEIWVGLPNLS